MYTIHSTTQTKTSSAPLPLSSIELCDERSLTETHQSDLSYSRLFLIRFPNPKIWIPPCECVAAPGPFKDPVCSFTSCLLSSSASAEIIRGEKSLACGNFVFPQLRVGKNNNRENVCVGVYVCVCVRQRHETPTVPGSLLPVSSIPTGFHMTKRRKLFCPRACHDTPS